MREEQRKELLEAQFGRHFDDYGSALVAPGTEADFEHWARMPYWRPIEGVALLCGRRLAHLTDDRIAEGLAQRSPFATRFAELRLLADRAHDAYHLRTKTPPADFMAWAKKLELPYPPELDELVSRFAVAYVDWHTRCLRAEAKLEELEARAESPSTPPEPTAPKPLTTKERATALKLIVGMAIRGYAWQPGAVRSKAVSDICGDLDTLAIGLDDDTVRRWLREGAELLPQETPESQAL